VHLSLIKICSNVKIIFFSETYRWIQQIRRKCICQKSKHKSVWSSLWRCVDHWKCKFQEICSFVQTKYHNFSVPVSENETGKLYIFLPNFETENLFLKNYSRKPETILGKTETIFGKPEKPISVSLSLPLCLSVCLSLSLTLSLT
jgi:hypothetical protein